MSAGRITLSIIALVASTLMAAFLLLCGIIWIGICVYDLTTPYGVASGELPRTQPPTPFVVKLPGAVITIGLGLVAVGLAILIIYLVWRRIWSYREENHAT